VALGSERVCAEGSLWLSTAPAQAHDVARLSTSVGQLEASIAAVRLDLREEMRLVNKSVDERVEFNFTRGVLPILNKFSDAMTASIAQSAGVKTSLLEATAALVHDKFAGVYDKISSLEATLLQFKADGPPADERCRAGLDEVRGVIGQIARHVGAPVEARRWCGSCGGYVEPMSAAHGRTGCFACDGPWELRSLPAVRASRPPTVSERPDSVYESDADSVLSSPPPLGVDSPGTATMAPSAPRAPGGVDAPRCANNDDVGSAAPTPAAPRATGGIDYSRFAHLDDSDGEPDVPDAAELAHWEQLKQTAGVTDDMIRDALELGATPEDVFLGVRRDVQQGVSSGFVRPFENWPVCDFEPDVEELD